MALDFIVLSAILANSAKAFKQYLFLSP